MVGWILFINIKLRVRNYLVWIKFGVFYNILDFGIDIWWVGMLKRDVFMLNRKVYVMILIKLKIKIKIG